MEKIKKMTRFTDETYKKELGFLNSSPTRAIMDALYSIPPTRWIKTEIFKGKLDKKVDSPQLIQDE